MTKVKVSAGACGFTSVIKVTRKNKTKVKVEIFSACKDLRSMSDDFNELDWHSGVFVKMTESAIYQSAAKRLIHADCPVPCAIIKAIQIEVDAMLPTDVSMKFDKNKGDSK